MGSLGCEDDSCAVCQLAGDVQAASAVAVVQHVVAAVAN
jgi:hypothetical protein